MNREKLVFAQKYRDKLQIENRVLISVIIENKPKSLSYVVFLGAMLCFIASD